MDETDEIDLADLEVQAKANALKQACTMLQRPDQLDNIEQYKKRILRKKAMTDAQLKTALQVSWVLVTVAKGKETYAKLIETKFI
jgi:lysozyme family protein